VLFEHGAFDATDAAATAEMLSAYAIGLPAFVLIKVFHPSYFARENTTTPMLFALAGMAVNIVLSFLLFLRVGPTGIPLAASFSGWLNAGLLLLWLRWNAAFSFDALFKRRFPAIVAASAIMGVCVWGMTLLLEPWFAPSNGLILQGLALGALVASGLLTYGVAAEWLGAVRLGSILAGLRRS
jgi:putative peptidoglycan lipid II flippase